MKGENKMLTAIYNSDDGIVYGKIKIIDFILCYRSIKKDDYYTRRWITLYPIEHYPFYKNYNKLYVPSEEVIFKFIV